MKKVFSVLLSVIMLVSTVTCVDLTAYSKYEVEYGSSGDFGYVGYSDGTASIIGCSETLEKVIIPSSINGYVVTCIANYTFFKSTTIKSIFLPNTITHIIEDSFYGCVNLESVSLPKGIKTIESYTFSNCESLKNIVIPESVTEIKEHAFSECTNLTSVDLGSNVATIGDYAFSLCANLSFIDFPDSLSSIGDHAFWDCISLQKIDIPSSVNSIELSFIGCDSVTNINVNSENSVFCSLDGVLFDKNISTLIQYPIGNARTTYTIPSSVTKVEKSAFNSCNSLNSVVVPKFVNKIDNFAFYKCENLSKIVINNSNCIIADDKRTFPETTTIHGHKNSTAQKYAENYERKFVVLDSNKCSTHKWNSGTVTKKATSSTNGTKTFKCTKCGQKKTTTINKVSNIKLSTTKYTYDGKVKKPSVTVKDSSGKALPSKSYTVNYSNGRKNIGEYKVTIKLTGNYSGTVTKIFQIAPSNVSAPTLSSSSTNNIIVKHKKKKSISGYRIQISKTSDFKDYYELNYKASNSDKDTITRKIKSGTETIKNGIKLSIKEGTKYYVRIRTYKNVKVNNKNKYIYSNWSSIKSVSSVSKIKINYKDSMLNKDGTNYNKDIALASCVLSKDAYNLNTLNSTINCDTMNYKILVKSPYYNSNNENKKDNDHCGYIIAKNNNLVQNQTVYLVVIRGTVGDEWISNGNIGGKNATTHRGFNKAKNEIKTDLEKIIGDKTDYKIWITGHSRGAAIANLLAADLIKNGLNYENPDTKVCKKIKVKEKNMYCYTFACPNVSTKTDSNLPIFNFNNESDFVAKVPLYLWGFKRNGKDIWFNEATKKANGKTIDMNAYNSNYKKYKGKNYKGMPYNTSEKIDNKFAEVAPTFDKYFGYQVKNGNNKGYCSPKKWFDSLMSEMAAQSHKTHNPWAVTKVLMSAADDTTGQLSILTGLFIDNANEIGNTHSMESYYSWVKEYTK